MSFLFNLINWIAELLPDSFISSWIGSHLLGTAQASVILSYVNYFVPVNHLAFMMSLWLPIISAVIVFFLIFNSK